MVELLLPAALLSKSSLQGNEYAWRLADVPEAISAARNLGLGTLGGQVQFRTPDGTCELYWLNANAEDWRRGEDWSEFVTRSAENVARGIADMVVGTDFVAEGIRSFGHLADMRSRGVDLEEFLWFVLYFKAPVAEQSVAPVGRE